MSAQEPALEAFAVELPPGFEAVYEAHYDFLWRSARRLGVDPGEIEDVVQDSFVIALRRFEQFDPRRPGRASSWLFAILRNVVRNRSRGARRRRARLDAYAATPSARTSEPAANTEAGLAAALLDEFLDSLDDDKRAAFVLADVEGMSGPELARALGVNRNTASSRLRAARRAFARHFDEPHRRPAALRELARERAPSGARARSLPVIALAAGYGGAGSGAVALGIGLLGSKLLAVAIGLASVLGAVAVLVHEPASTLAEVTGPGSSAERETVTPSSAAAPAPSPSPPAALAEGPAAQPTSRPPQSQPRSRSKPKPKYARELDRLGDAREALLAGDPGRALELVEGRRFVASLEGRRIAVEVAALCELDRVAIAQRRVEAWRRAHPGDPLAAKLDEVCKADSP